MEIGQKHELTINDGLNFTKNDLGWVGGNGAGDTGLGTRVESRATSTCDTRASLENYENLKDNISDTYVASISNRSADRALIQCIKDDERKCSN